MTAGYNNASPAVAQANGVQTLAAVSSKATEAIEVKTALISVFDKSGLEDLGKFLKEKNVHILSTGGTAKKLRELGCSVQDVAEYTGSPEILDGRVKSLHPKVHGGLLAARGSQKHREEMKEHGIVPIDLTIVNLYPFEQAVAAGGDFATCIENIDIGGPAMVRASAKNNAAAAYSMTAAYDSAVSTWMAGQVDSPPETK